MKILFINEVCGHTSTGKICADLAEKYEAGGNEVKIAYGRDGFVPEKYQKFAIRIGNDWDVKLHALYTRLTDKHGLASKTVTKKFLKWAEQYDPDLLWLHNLHGYYINYEMLFDWIKSRPEMEVKWTLHDCWAFTGHCTHFTYVKCEKWKSECEHCPQTKRYPSSVLIDNSKGNYDHKKNAFIGVKKMKLITPSNWLKSLVQQSFLKVYPIDVVHNTINKSIFKPTQSDFREKYGLENKIIILGIANVWDERKGLGDLLKLSKSLSKNFFVVIVGLSEKQIKRIKKEYDNVITLGKTNNQIELAKIYSSADYYVNPSREETFGMTNLEAILCGTTVICYENTACEEICNKYGGYVCKQDVNCMAELIVSLERNKSNGK